MNTHRDHSPLYFASLVLCYFIAAWPLTNPMSSFMTVKLIYNLALCQSGVRSMQQNARAVSPNDSGE